MTAGLILVVGGAAAGMFGSLLGLGGGLLIVPLLTLAFGVPLREAVAVSLVAVIVTSTAGAGVYLRRHVANLRLGMVLELFTAMGALVGGLVAFVLDEQVLAGLFAVVLTWVAISMIRQGRRTPATGPAAATLGRATDDEEPTDPDLRHAAIAPARAPAAAADAPTPPGTSAPATFTDTLSGEGYHVRRLRFGMLASVGAGVVSALLGVGGGIVKVPVMVTWCGVPMRVAAATSALMIGVTAVSGAAIYLGRGGLMYQLAAAAILGTQIGSAAGLRLSARTHTTRLKGLLSIVLMTVSLLMLGRSL